MDIKEVLQGLSNLGGEMPRVTKPKRIKEIKPGKKNSNVRKRRGPMNIDLSKLGEEVEAMRDLVERAKQVKAKSKMPKKMKPNTGHESPHPYQGQLVGEADDEGWLATNTKSRGPAGECPSVVCRRRCGASGFSFWDRASAAPPLQIAVG